jgi:hypothetical protein
MRGALNRSVRASLIAVAFGLGCQDIAGFDGNPVMDPGKNCMQCHSATGQASALPWSVAGTVFPTPTSAADMGLANAEILIVDSAAPPKSITIRSNGAGNFFTAESFSGDIHVAVQFGGQRYQMQESPPTGSCNLCHGLDAAGQPLPLPAPYVDAGFDYGMASLGRLFVPVTGPDAGGE